MYGSQSMSHHCGLSAWSTRASFSNLNLIECFIRQVRVLQAWVETTGMVVVRFDLLATWPWGMRLRCKFWEQHMTWSLRSGSSLSANWVIWGPPWGSKLTCVRQLVCNKVCEKKIRHHFQKQERCWECVLWPKVWSQVTGLEPPHHWW